MTLYFVLNLADAILTSLLSGFVILKARTKPVGRALSIWLVAVSVWSLGVAMHATSSDMVSALFWSRVLHYGAVPLPVLYLNFTLALLDEKRPKIMAVMVALTVGFILLIPTKYFIREVTPILNFFAFPKAGPFYLWFVLMFSVCVTMSFILYAKTLSRLDGITRNRVKYVFYGSAIGFSFGATAFLPMFDVPVFPFGTPCVVLNAVLITYAILRFRLMDISIIIRKTLVYSTVMGVLTCIYLGTITLFAHVFEGFAGGQTVYSSAIAAFLITLCFQPLRKKVQSLVDAKFFRQYVDREEKLYELSREVITHTTPEAMGQALMHVIEETLHPKTGGLYLRSRDGSGFVRVSATSSGELPARMEEDNELAKYFKDHPLPFVQEMSSEIGQSQSTRNKDEREDAA